MILIVGLGNPGEKYEGTRHNLGFIVIDQLLKDFEPAEKTIWNTEAKLKSEIVHIDWQPKKSAMEKVILAKPNTYMNNSGMAVELIRNYYKIDPSDIWVVYDELDLPLGSMKIRFGGAAAGHRGVESIIGALGTDQFWRFRLGIGAGSEHSARHSRENGGNEKLIARRKLHNVEDFVLGHFTGHDKGKLKEITKHGAKALETALEKGLKSAQNRYNTK